MQAWVFFPGCSHLATTLLFAGADPLSSGVLAAQGRSLVTGDKK